MKCHIIHNRTTIRYYMTEKWYEHTAGRWIVVKVKRI